MAATRLNRTFNHLTFDDAKNVELHFALEEDAKAFISDKIKAQDSELAIPSDIDFKIIATSECPYHPRQVCWSVTLQPNIFDLYAGRINGQNVYPQLVKLAALIAADFTNDFIETLVKMDSQVQAYALRFVLPLPKLTSVVHETFTHLYSSTQQQQFVEIIKNMPEDVCNEIALLGRKNSKNRVIDIILTDTPHLFLSFIAELSPEIRDRSALLKINNSTIIALAINLLSAENLTAYINQLNPQALTQAAIMSKVFGNTRDGYYSIHMKMDKTLVTNPALQPFLTIDNQNELLMEFKNLLNLKKQIEESWIAYFGIGIFKFNGKVCEINLQTSKAIVTIIKETIHGEYFIREATALIRRKLNLQEKLVTVSIHAGNNLSEPLVPPSHSYITSPSSAIVAESKSDSLILQPQADNTIFPQQFDTQSQNLKDYVDNVSYSKQIIINLLDRDTFASLKGKWDSKLPSLPRCNILDLQKGLEPELDVSRYQPNDFVRIYVLGDLYSADKTHCLVLNGNAFSILDLANIILPLVRKVRCIINLVVPYAGFSNPSFATNLHEHIFSETKINVPVIARKNSTLVLSFEYTRQGNFNFLKMTKQADNNLLASKQPGSKIIVTIDNVGNQIKLDAYAFRWRKRINNGLTKISNEARNKKIQNLLIGWINVIDKMSLGEIHNLISCEINNASSILKEQSSNTFFPDYFEWNRVNALLNEIKEVIKSNPRERAFTKAGMANRPLLQHQ